MESRYSEALGAGDDLDSLEGVEAAALARALAEFRVRDAAAGRALRGPHLSDLEAVYEAKGMPAAACSTGEQKALLISVALATARALAGATGTAPILLLDEVAAHLDARRRGALFAEIEALGAQAWMTGTGAGLFEGVAPGTLRLAVSESGGRSALARA
jgi:DNA replication and repair protein RecF